MELDVTEKQPSPNGAKKETRECYNYGIKEYLARDYHKPKIESGPQKKTQAQRRYQKQVLITEVTPPQKENRQIVILEKHNTETVIPHASLSWTACYDHDCRIHLSDKDGSGWFPRRPRRGRSLCMMSRRGRLDDIGERTTRRRQAWSVDTERGRRSTSRLRRLIFQPLEELGSDEGDSRERAFADAELTVPDSPELMPNEDPQTDSEPDRMDLAWERSNKGKKRAPDDKPESKKDIEPFWVEAYQDVCTTIRKRSDSEQFEQKLYIIKARIREVNKKLITLLEMLRTSWPYKVYRN